MLEAVVSQLNCIFLGFDGVASDLELQVKRKKREIVARDVTHKREDLGPLGIFGSQKLGTGRFGGASQFPKEVQLKGRVSGVGSISGCEREALKAPFIHRIRVCGQLRELVRARDSELSACLGDFLRGRLQVVVLLESPPD